jgi:Spy/CpxP family protein refolding chaperone
MNRRVATILAALVTASVVSVATEAASAYNPCSALADAIYYHVTNGSGAYADSLASLRDSYKCPALGTSSLGGNAGNQARNF